MKNLAFFLVVLLYSCKKNDVVSIMNDINSNGIPDRVFCGNDLVVKKNNNLYSMCDSLKMNYIIFNKVIIFNYKYNSNDVLADGSLVEKIFFIYMNSSIINRICVFKLQNIYYLYEVDEIIDNNICRYRFLPKKINANSLKFIFDIKIDKSQCLEYNYSFSDDEMTISKRLPVHDSGDVDVKVYMSSKNSFTLLSILKMIDRKNL